jgi:hypothetical protein
MKLAYIFPIAGVLIAAAACASPSPSVVQMDRERAVCARMGFEPGSRAFAQCVGNLDASIFEANNTAAR